MKSISGVACLIIVASVACNTAAAQGDPSSGTITLVDAPAQVSAYIGLSSSGGVTASCPPGKMVIGVAGSKLKFVQKITPICGSYSKTGALVSSAPLDPGAAAIAPFNLQCVSGRVVTRLRVSWNPNTTVYPYLGGVEISCLPWVVAQWSSEAFQTLATTGFESWSSKAQVSCSSQMQPVRALRIRTSTALKALSIICDEL